MHSTKLVSCEDFRFTNGQQQWSSNVDDFCPGFSPKDRFVFVRPQIEDCIRHAGLAVLALVQHFYRLAAKAESENCRYPNWRCILQRNRHGFRSKGTSVNISIAEAGAAWSNLDIFPEDRWRTVELIETEIQQELEEHRATRVFIPFGLSELMRSRVKHDKIVPGSVKTVWIYGVGTFNCCVQGTDEAVSLVGRSLRIVEQLHQERAANETGVSLWSSGNPGICRLERIDVA